MTSRERMYALYEAIRYIVNARIPGDIVECGVWRGGSSMLSAMTLDRLEDRREMWMYDTFAGMPEPSSTDSDDEGRPILDKWAAQQRNDGGNDWCFSSIEETEHNLRKTGYPSASLHFVKGKVQDTIPGSAPERIALLRLDTDWYDSTFHELTHLFPRLSEGGVLLIDDYGRWQGQRKAVDQYLRESNLTLLLNRVDDSGRIATKFSPNLVSERPPHRS
jgi:O-methyltransferase